MTTKRLLTTWPLLALFLLLSHPLPAQAGVSTTAASLRENSGVVSQTGETTIFSLSSEAKLAAATNRLSGNHYPVGQCTWGVKEQAPWVHTYWGNATDWATNAAADGFTVGKVPVVGAIAVWTDPNGGYGHVAYVTGVESETSIEVLEANIGGNPNIANYRGFFNPTTTAEGTISYIYPPQNSN